MSSCISQHGEYSSHEPADDFCCSLCGVLDEDALRSKLVQLTDERDRARRLAARLEEELSAALAVEHWEELNARPRIMAGLKPHDYDPKEATRG